MAFTQNLQEKIEQGQGAAGRTLDRLPKFAQESLAKLLGYPYQYPQLDSFTKCLSAVFIFIGFYRNIFMKVRNPP